MSRKLPHRARANHTSIALRDSSRDATLSRKVLLLPCPKIDRCQQPLPVTRVPERGSNNRDPLRAGNDSKGDQHRVVSQGVPFNPFISA